VTFYRIGADRLPWGVQCFAEECDARLEPSDPPCESTDDVMLAMQRHGWGFDAWGGRNLPSCPKHTEPMDVVNLENILARLRTRTEPDVGSGGATA
jgi:hypothetical protein